MKSPIQTPISFNVLRWFGIPRNPEDALIKLASEVVPTFEVMPMLSIENQEIATGTGTVALGLNTIFTNNAALTPNVDPQPRAIWSMDQRLGSAIGVGVQVGLVPVRISLVGPGGFTATTPLGDFRTFVAGEFPIWGVKFPTSAPLILLPGESLGFWCMSLVGASPNFTNAVIHRVLTS